MELGKFNQAISV